MALSEIVLRQGTKIRERLGVEPERDAGLIRSMFNMLIHLVVILGLVRAFNV